MARRMVIALLALVSLFQLATCQQLTLAECVVNCTSDVTSRFSSCTSGVQCFCSDPALFDLTKKCWDSNCTIRESLTGLNVTSITCDFPKRNRGPISSAVTFTSMGIALFMVGTRILAKAPKWKQSVWWDDALVALATVLMIGNAACNPISRHHGYGGDTWLLPFQSTMIVEMLFFIGGILYTTAVSATKVAFILFYLRLFPSKTFRWIAFPLLTVTVLHGIIFTFLFTFQCSPVSYTWTQWDGSGQGKCLSFDVGAVFHAVSNILLDIVIFALPIWQLWDLNLSKKKKFQVMSMFLVGFFVTLVSVLRLWSLAEVANTRNPTWDLVPLGYFSDLELNVGVVCICMPSLRIVVRRYFPTCGLATTDGVEDSHSRPQPVPRRIDLSESSISNNRHVKSFMPSTRRVTADDDSDQVELCTYSASVTTKS